MKKIVPALLALPLALSGLAVAAAPAAADDRRCSGSIGPRYVDRNVIVATSRPRTTAGSS